MHLISPGMIRFNPFFTALLIIAYATSGLVAQKPSAIVFRDSGSCLRYIADAENNYIPDFSQVGYRNGDAPIPVVPVVKTIGPLAGDNTQHIQAALSEVAALPPDSHGIRGALLLKPGRYEVQGSIVIKESGVVLRGSGQGANPDSNTVLVAVGNTPASRIVVQAGYGSNVGWVAPFPAIRTPVTAEFIPAGSRTLSVLKPEWFKPGDNVIVYQASTQKWLQSIDFGATDVDAPWKPGEIDLYFNRYVQAVYPGEGKIELDIPIYDHIEPALAPVEVYIPFNPGTKNNIGIERLRIDIQTAGPEDEAHALSALKFYGVEDCWVKEVTALHFTYAGIDMELATRITVQDCYALEPHSLITGERRYNFTVASRTNNVLFTRCHATEGRHSFVSNGASSVSGIVFHEGTSNRDHNSSEGHRRWSQALLYDNLQFTNTQSDIPLALYNRGSHGTGHGWSSVHSVAWNVNAPLYKRIVVQKPPRRQNYAIGCSRTVSNDYIFFHPAGYIEGTNTPPAPASLYLAQREDRMKNGIKPDAPARLQALRNSADGSIRLQWLDIAANESGYRVERSDDGGATFVPIADLPANATTFSTRAPGNPVYRVFAHRNGCGSATSNPAQVQSATQVQHLDPGSWSVFPNPVEEVAHIRSDFPIRAIEVYDSLGRPITNPRSGLLLDRISFATSPAGIYFLKVQNNQGAVGVRRIVKK